jgi:hypothetical protein
MRRFQTALFIEGSVNRKGYRNVAEDCPGYLTDPPRNFGEIYMGITPVGGEFINYAGVLYKFRIDEKLQ